jgi:flavin reductase (DIM6/NTAB) family NADH-FMN oxidoreductase RutF/rubredoxin
MIELEALFKITYGLFIVCSGDKSRGNGYISNTVFQVTADPPQFAICCSKNNFTAEFIKKTGVFSVSILEQETPPEILGRFGFKSGRDFNKLEGMSVKYGETNVPIVLDSSLAYMEFSVINTVEAGTHLIFIGKLIQSVLLDKAKEPLTYQYYRQVRNGAASRNAPTYIDKSKLEAVKTSESFKKYRCMCCGFIYNEEKEKIRFSDLPDSWTCPVCGSDKSDFIEV